MSLSSSGVGVSAVPTVILGGMGGRGEFVLMEGLRCRVGECVKGEEGVEGVVGVVGRESEEGVDLCVCVSV